MKRLGIVTGLVVEAARIEMACRGFSEAEKPLVGVAGGSAERAAHLAKAQVAAGVEGLVSFGIAGGLDPSLSPGDIVVGTNVWCAAETYSNDASASWARSFISALGNERRVHTGGIAGVDNPAVSAVEKEALRRRSEALAVDMESHGAAQVATEAKIPLLVIRAVADPASRAVPMAALAGMGPDGRRRPMAVLGRLLASPKELSALFRLARDSSAALRSLSVAARILVHTERG